MVGYRIGLLVQCRLSLRCIRNHTLVITKYVCWFIFQRYSKRPQFGSQMRNGFNAWSQCSYATFAPPRWHNAKHPPIEYSLLFALSFWDRRVTFPLLRLDSVLGNPLVKILIWSDPSSAPSNHSTYPQCVLHVPSSWGRFILAQHWYFQYYVNSSNLRRPS